MTFTPEQIETAVEWWCGAIGRPKYDALGSQRDRPMEMAQVMMSALGARLTDEQIEAFAVHLRLVLAGECSHTWTSPSSGCEMPIRPDWVLSVDYDPDIVLRHCGEVAGFPAGFFWPIKTTMWLRDGGVSVAYGYRAPIQELDTAKGLTKNDEALTDAR